MRYWWFMLLISLTSGPSVAQQKYFAYFQSDPRTPFSARIQNQIYSSTANGYLILPQLADSTYKIIFGFPGNQWPDQEFDYQTNKKDQGFLLKYFKDQGAWGLFNLQTADVQMGRPVEKSKNDSQSGLGVLTQDQFTVILASVVDDAGLRSINLLREDQDMIAQKKSPVSPMPAVTSEKTVPADKNVSQQHTEPIAAAPNTAPVLTTPSTVVLVKESSPENKEKENIIPISDSAALAKQDKTEPVREIKAAGDSTSQAEVAEPVQLMTGIAYTHIVKEWQIRLKSGIQMRFIDEQRDGKKDTIELTIPENEAAVGVVMVKNDHLPVQKEPDEKPVFLDMTIAPRKETKPVQAPVPLVNDTTEITKKDTVDVLRGDEVWEKPGHRECRRYASPKDVNLLRSKMVVMTNNDEIVNLAVRNFRQKCFSSDDVKSLCYVFIKDEGKFSLLQAAYPYVYDPENFAGLEPVLTDDSFIRQFRDLVK